MVGNTAEVVKRLVTETMPIRTLFSALLLVSIAAATVHTHSPHAHYHVVHGWPVVPEKHDPGRGLSGRGRFARRRPRLTAGRSQVARLRTIRHVAYSTP